MKRTIELADSIYQGFMEGGKRVQGTIGLSSDGETLDFHPHRRMERGMNSNTPSTPPMMVVRIKRGVYLLISSSPVNPDAPISAEPYPRLGKSFKRIDLSNLSEGGFPDDWVH